MQNISAPLTSSLFLISAFATACGGEDPSMMMVPDNAVSPLVGAWRTTNCIESAGSNPPCIVQLGFQPTGEFIATDGFVDPANGCRTVVAIQGYRYTATASTFSVTADAPRGRLSRGQCPNPADNVDEQAFTPPPGSVESAGTSFSVSGAMLTVRSAVYERFQP